MKITKVLVLCLLGLVPFQIFAQKSAILTCEEVDKILLSAKNDFKDILGDLETKVQDCNYYYAKVSFGIDSTTTLQSCKDHKGHLILHFDTFISNDEIQSDFEFKTLEDMLDKCLPTAKIIEAKPGDFKRIVQYRINGIQLTAYQDIVKNHNDVTPLVTVSVIKIK